jgi:glycosyltransferase involved in cell wall biosynthesis
LPPAALLPGPGSVILSVFKPCVIIPVYNHHQVIARVVDQVKHHGLPCMLVDDGSDQQCRQVLEAIALDDPGVTLLRFDDNRGKGVAVCTALAAAHERGFSHALQVDADGQHNLDDIPRFIDSARQCPDAVISGSRIYGYVPPSRRYGRKLTDGLVWLQTLSTTIKDSMCGYRVYPLAATESLLEHSSIGRRMDFDTDILVRLYWEGVDVVHVDTPVIYQDDIPSHFDLLRDNARITKMHIRLVFGMLVRIPGLVARNSDAPQNHAPN